MKIRTLEELDKLDAKYSDEPKNEKNWAKTFIYESYFLDGSLANAYTEFSLAKHPGAEKFGKEILRRIVENNKDKFKTGDKTNDSTHD